MSKHLTVLCVLCICLAACRPTPTATPTALPTRTPEAPTATPVPACQDCFTFYSMRIYPGLFTLAVKSTLPDGTCLRTQLFVEDEPLDWWPTETCAEVQDGTWRISVSLQERGAPYERPPEGAYTLVAWQEERRIASAMFWLDYSGPPTPSPTLVVAPTATPLQTPAHTPTPLPTTTVMDGRDFDWSPDGQALVVSGTSEQRCARPILRPNL